MPTLFPPLEAQDESLLPAQVRANFDAIRAIIRAQSRSRKEEQPPTGGTADDGKKRKRGPTDAGGGDVTVGEKAVGEDSREDGVESRKIQLAVETAVAAESEISLLKNGIAELEALLLQQGNGIDPAEIEFPNLPSIVSDEYLEKEGKGCDDIGEPDAGKEEMEALDGGTK